MNDDIEVDTATELPARTSRGRARSRFYSDIAVKARKNPAEWVVLRGYKSAATGTQMRKGKYPAINPDDYEIEMRRNADGERWDLYLKYTGPTAE